MTHDEQREHARNAAEIIEDLGWSISSTVHSLKGWLPKHEDRQKVVDVLNLVAGTLVELDKWTTKAYEATRQKEGSQSDGD